MVFRILDDYRENQDEYIPEPERGLCIQGFRVLNILEIRILVKLGECQQS